MSLGGGRNVSTRKLEALKCASCGKVFVQRHGNQKYCSVSCRQKPQVYTQYTHTCRSCNTIFKSKYKDSLFCSRECGDMQTVIKCRQCNKPIQVACRDIYRIKYCSFQCRKTAKKEQDKRAKKRWLAKQPYIKNNFHNKKRSDVIRL